MSIAMTPLEAAITLIGRNPDAFQWAEALYQLLVSSTEEDMDQLLGSPRLANLQRDIHGRLYQLDEDRDAICKKLAAVSTPSIALLMFSPVEGD